MNTWNWTPGEFLLAAALAIGAVLVLVMWTAGQLAVLVATGHTLEAGLGDATSALIALPTHLDRPAAAWPAETRGDIPGPLGFYLALLVAMALAAAAVLAALTAAARAGLLPAFQGQAGGRAARWAKPSDLRALTVQKPTARRVTLGRMGGRLVAAEPLHSALVVAPTGTGKTAGLAVPAILEWQGPVVASSVTTDLVRDTFMRRSAVGDVKVFDPAGTSGLPRASWSPLGAVRDWRSAREQAQRLVSAVYAARGAQETDALTQQSVRYLAPLLLAGARDRRSIGEVLVWVQSGDHDEAIAALGGEEEYDPDLLAAQASLRSVGGAGEAARATAQEALDPYGEPTVGDSARGSDISPAWLLDGPNTLYLYGTARTQEQLRPLYVTLLDQIVSEVHERSARDGRPIDPPLLLVLDGAASVAPPPDLAQIAAGGRAQGIQLVTVLQDLQQADRRWRGDAETIVNNHRAKVIGAGVSDTRTVDYVARMLGDEQINQVSMGMVSSGGGGSRSRTQSTAWRSLAPANVLREGPDGSAILIYGNLPPARLELRPWFREPALRALAHTQEAETTTAVAKSS